MMRAVTTAATLLLSVTACTNDVVFVTKTGFGLGFDATPPSLDVAYMRQEGVIAPVFDDVASEEKGSTIPVALPMLTTVGTRSEDLGLAADHSFATGPAAMVFADALTDSADYDLGGKRRVPQPTMDGIVLRRSGSCAAPFFFGTTTNFGLLLQWGQDLALTSANIGWKRREIALVPLRHRTVWQHTPSGRLFSLEELAASEQLNEGMLDVEKSGTKENIAELKAAGRLVEMESTRLPSLIATAQAGADPSQGGKARFKVSQTFATGAAATLLAKHGKVRRALGPMLIPEVVFNAFAEGHVEIADISFILANVEVLEKLATQGDDQAAALRKDLDTMAAGIDYPVFRHYTDFDAGANSLTAEPDSPVGGPSFRELVSYLAALHESSSVLAEANKAQGIDMGMSLVGFTPGKPDETLIANRVLAGTVDTDRTRQQALLSTMTKQVGSDSRLVAALRYVSTRTLGGD